MNGKNVTLKDIAARAGCSITTVSHVINKTRYVKKETREYVLKVLEELNYNRERPKTQGRRIELIGLIVADIVEDYSISVIKAIETYASEQGISILLCDSEDDLEKEKKNIRTILDRNVSGLILSPIHSEKYPQELLKTDIPVVLIDRQYSNHKNVFVGINNFESGFTATKHLIERGSRRVGFVGYHDTVYTVKQRAMGYKACIQEHLPESPRRVLQLSYNKEDSNKLIIDFIQKNSPDALLCATSDICYQVISSLEEFDAAALARIKIITYDDNKWLDYLKYPISVITQPTAEISVYAIERLIQMIENPGDNKKIGTEVLFDTGFIDRL